MEYSSKWKCEIINRLKLQFENGIAGLPNDITDNRLSFYEYSSGGVAQKNWSDDFMRASYYDTPRYKDQIKRVINDSKCKDPVIIDMGCGDGRGVQILLDLGVQKIVAVDFHLKSLLNLYNGLTEEQRECVLPILGNVALEIPSEIGDIMLLVEVLTTLEEPHKALVSACKWLRSSGIVYISEPAIENSLYYALIQHDDDAIRRIITSSKRIDKVGGASLEIHIHSAETLNCLCQNSGLEVLTQDNLPGGAAAFICGSHFMPSLSQSAKDMLEKVNFLKQCAPRMHTITCRK